MEYERRRINIKVAGKVQTAESTKEEERPPPRGRGAGQPVRAARKVQIFMTNFSVSATLTSVALA